MDKNKDKIIVERIHNSRFNLEKSWVFQIPFALSPSAALRRALSKGDRDLEGPPNG